MPRRASIDRIVADEPRREVPTALVDAVAKLRARIRPAESPQPREVSPADVQRRAVNNAMNRLLSYPHRRHGDAFVREVGFDELRVAEVLARWRNEERFDGTRKVYVRRFM
jgi:hypothetical protein